MERSQYIYHCRTCDLTYFSRFATVLPCEEYRSHAEYIYWDHLGKGMMVEPLQAMSAPARDAKHGHHSSFGDQTGLTCGMGSDPSRLRIYEPTDPNVRISNAKLPRRPILLVLLFPRIAIFRR